MVPAQIGQNLPSAESPPATGTPAPSPTPETASVAKPVTAITSPPKSSNAPQLTLLLIVLLLAYSMPVIVAAGNWIYRSDSSSKSIFDAGLVVTQLLVQTAQSKKEYLGLFQQLIVPVLAAFTALGFEQIRSQRFASWLFMLPLALLILSIVLSTVFHSLTDLDVAKAKEVKDFFAEIAQNLTIYVLMLLGLEGAHQRKVT